MSSNVTTITTLQSLLVTWPWESGCTSSLHRTVPRRCDINNGDCRHMCFYDVDGVGRCKCRDGWVLDRIRERKCWGEFMCFYQYVEKSNLPVQYKVVMFPYTLYTVIILIIIIQDLYLFEHPHFPRVVQTPTFEIPKQSQWSTVQENPQHKIIMSGREQSRFSKRFLIQGACLDCTSASRQ